MEGLIHRKWRKFYKMTRKTTEEKVLPTPRNRMGCNG